MQCMLQNNRVEPLHLGFSFSEKVESCYLHGYSRNLIIYRAVTKGVTACIKSADEMPISPMTSAEPGKFQDNKVLSALVLPLP